MAKRDPSHHPFSVLADMVRRGDIALAPESVKRVAAPKKFSSSLTDAEAFELEMATVRPLGWSATPLTLPDRYQMRATASSETEALSQLKALVSGQGEIDPFALGEGIEGAWSSRGEDYLARLKRGDFSVQDHLDLHGLDSGEARAKLVGFLKDAQHRGLTCVRVVHGRGRHSQEEPAALKRAVRRFLSSRRMSRIVIAFASARWRDGGGGALYVLLYGKWRPPRNHSRPRERRSIDRKRGQGGGSSD